MCPQTAALRATRAHAPAHPPTPLGASRSGVPAAVRERTSILGRGNHRAIDAVHRRQERLLPEPLDDAAPPKVAVESRAGGGNVPDGRGKSRRITWRDEDPVRWLDE